MRLLPANEDIQRLAAAFKSKALRSMCRRVGAFAPSTKYGMAAALISWDRQCVRLGRLFYEEQRAIAAARSHHQLMLKLF